MKYRKRADGKTVARVHTTDPAALMALEQWVLHSDHPDAIAAREWLMNRDISHYVPPDVTEICDLDGNVVVVEEKGVPK